MAVTITTDAIIDDNGAVVATREGVGRLWDCFVEFTERANRCEDEEINRVTHVWLRHMGMPEEQIAATMNAWGLERERHGG